MFLLIGGIVLADDATAFYDLFLEDLFTFNDQYQANYWYCWVNHLMMNIRIILALAIPMLLLRSNPGITKRYFVIIGAIEALMIAKVIDTVAMPFRDLESYDSIWWELLCLAIALTIQAISKIPKRIKARKMQVMEEERREIERQRKEEEYTDRFIT